QVGPRQAPDTSPPVLTVLGDTITVVSIFSTYQDLGALAMDARDGPLPVAVSGLPMPGTNWTSIPTEEGQNGIEVVYSATDTSGNAATALRYVKVRTGKPGVVRDISSAIQVTYPRPIDTRQVPGAARTASSDATSIVAPTLRLQGAAIQAVAAGIAMPLPYTQVGLLYCGINGDVPGTYDITYSVANNVGGAQGVSVTVTRVLIVQQVCDAGEAFQEPSISTAPPQIILLPSLATNLSTTLASNATVHLPYGRVAPLTLTPCVTNASLGSASPTCAAIGRDVAEGDVSASILEPTAIPTPISSTSTSQLSYSFVVPAADTSDADTARQLAAQLLSNASLVNSLVAEQQLPAFGIHPAYQPYVQPPITTRLVQATVLQATARLANSSAGSGLTPWLVDVTVNVTMASCVTPPSTSAPSLRRRQLLHQYGEQRPLSEELHAAPYEDVGSSLKGLLGAQVPRRLRTLALAASKATTLKLRTLNVHLGWVAKEGLGMLHQTTARPVPLADSFETFMWGQGGHQPLPAASWEGAAHPRQLMQANPSGSSSSSSSCGATPRAPSLVGNSGAGLPGALVAASVASTTCSTPSVSAE
ncbi:hypothetical protein QJQ45_013710, partial [Haematococcus lacustris]